MATDQTSTDILRAAFPGRVALSPQEIAQALFGADKATKKRIESVREALDEGRLVPGIRKTGARWRVPIAALGAALDEQRRRETAVARDVAPDVRRSAHSTLGPRMLLQVNRSRQVWLDIQFELQRLYANAFGARLENSFADAPVVKKPLPDRF